MQNLNEEDFKKKYFKYKAKYLELKELLEGGRKKSKSRPDCERITVKQTCLDTAGCYLSGSACFNN